MPPEVPFNDFEDESEECHLTAEQLKVAWKVRVSNYDDVGQ